MFFWSELTIMLLILFKILISDDIQNDTSEIYATVFIEVLRYISVVIFISIEFVVVKLKDFSYRIDSAPMKWPLFGGFWALTC